MPSIRIGAVRAVGGYFKCLSAIQNRYRSMGDACGNRLAEDALHLFGTRIGCDVKILGFNPPCQEKIPHGSTDQPGFLAVPAEFTHKVQEWLWNDFSCQNGFRHVVIFLALCVFTLFKNTASRARDAKKPPTGRRLFHGLQKPCVISGGAGEPAAAWCWPGPALPCRTAAGSGS